MVFHHPPPGRVVVISREPRPSFFTKGNFSLGRESVAGDPT